VLRALDRAALWLYNEAALKADGSQHSMLGGRFFQGRLLSLFIHLSKQKEHLKGRLFVPEQFSTRRF
jgi:hypothetical protein